MKFYRVGGAVRDRLLGKPSKDQDWVVVGGSPEQMLAAGYRPVGRDFPVFLHPDSGEEYALARTERKSGRGYRGFHFYTCPEVRLEDDLRRRDLTINAIAESLEGELIDPFGGQEDIRRGLLRHISPAFVEDPLRVLRVARFAAQLDFQVAPETLQCMRQISASGELETLTPERVWREWERALDGPRPVHFFQVLNACGALGRLLPPALGELPALRLLERAAARTSSARARLAAHAAILGEEAQLRALAERYRLPFAFRRAAQRTLRCLPLIRGGPWNAELVFTVLESADLLRQPEHLAELCDALSACTVEDAAPNPPGSQTAAAVCPVPEMERRVAFLPAAYEAARSVDARALLAQKLSGAALGQALRARRVQAIQRCLEAQ